MDNMKELAKTLLKKKIIIAIIGVLSSTPVIFVVLFIAIIVVLGFFDDAPKSMSNDNLASTNVGTTYVECKSITVDGKIYSLEDYVAGVVEHEAYTSEGMEALKAQAITARTYAIVKTNNCSKAIGNSTKEQTFDENPGENAKKAAQETEGMVLIYDGKMFSTQYDSFCYDDSDCSDATKNSDGSYSVTYTKLPNKETHKITLSASDLVSKVLSGQGHANGMSQLVSYQMAREGKTYEEILKFFYSDGVQISKLTSLANEGGTTNSGSNEYDTTFTASNGKIYKNYKQCDEYYNKGLTTERANWLCSVGCGLTSAAITISGNNKNITPAYLYDNYRAPMGYVSIDTYLSKYSTGYKSVSTHDKNILIEHLKTGGTAILFVTNGCSINGQTWTNSQHYFTALAYNSSDNTIYISNPGRKDLNDKNGWQSVDAIMGCAMVNYLVN